MQTLPSTAATTNEVLGLRAVDGVLHLSLDEKASFEALRKSLRDTFSATPDRFRGKNARLEFGTRPIDLFDLRRLTHVLKDEFGVHVTGLYCDQQALLRYAERELKLRVYPSLPQLSEPLPEEDSEPAEDSTAVQEDDPQTAEPFDAGSRVLSIRHGLRSGQVIHYTGDVAIFGDVNPGAEIVAGGTILVLGALRGMVHAGSNGDDEAIVLAFDLRPTQLRIGRHITFPTDSPNRAVGVYSPQIAWVRDETIHIEPYRGKLPQ